MGFFQVFLLFFVLRFNSGSQDVISREKILQRTSQSKIISSLESFIENSSRNPRSKILNSLESLVGSNSLEISVHRNPAGKTLKRASVSMDKNAPKEKKGTFSSDGSGSGTVDWKDPIQHAVKHTQGFDSPVGKTLNSESLDKNEPKEKTGAFRSGARDWKDPIPLGVSHTIQGLVDTSTLTKTVSSAEKVITSSLHDTENSNQSLATSAPSKDVRQISDEKKRYSANKLVVSPTSLATSAQAQVITSFLHDTEISNQSLGTSALAQDVAQLSDEQKGYSANKLMATQSLNSALAQDVAQLSDEQKRYSANKLMATQSLTSAQAQDVAQLSDEQKGYSANKLMASQSLATSALAQDVAQLSDEQKRYSANNMMPSQSLATSAQAQDVAQLSDEQKRYSANNLMPSQSLATSALAQDVAQLSDEQKRYSANNLMPSQSLATSALAQDVAHSDEQKGKIKPERHQSIRGKSTSGTTTDESTKSSFIYHDGDTVQNDQLQKQFYKYYANKFVENPNINPDLTINVKLNVPKTLSQNEQLHGSSESGTGFESGSGSGTVAESGSESAAGSVSGSGSWSVSESVSGSGSGSGPGSVSGSGSGFGSMSGSGSGSGSVSGLGSGSGALAEYGEAQEESIKFVNGEEVVPSSPSPSTIRARKLSLHSESRQNDVSIQKSPPVWNEEDADGEASDSGSGSGSSESGSGSGMLTDQSNARKSFVEADEKVEPLPEPVVYVVVDEGTKPSEVATTLRNQTKEPEEQEVTIRVDFHRVMDQSGSPANNNGIGPSTVKGSATSDNEMLTKIHPQSGGPINDIVVGSSNEKGSAMSGNEMLPGNHKQSTGNPVNGIDVSSSTEKGSAMSGNEMLPGNHTQSTGNPVNVNGVSSSNENGSSMSGNEMLPGSHPQSGSPVNSIDVSSSAENGSAMSDNGMLPGNNTQSTGSPVNGKDVGSSTENGSAISDNEMLSGNHPQSGSPVYSINVSSSAENGSTMSGTEVLSERYKNLHQLVFSAYNSHSKTVENNKAKKDEALEQEKKLIALSTKTEQIDASTSVTLQTMAIKQFHPANKTTETTKHTKLDYDLAVEKEKKLIAASVRGSNSSANGTGQTKLGKVSNSAELHDHAKASFRSRYFEEKGRKVIKKFQEDKLASLLDAVRFGQKSSPVNSTTQFNYLKQCGLFVEDYNVTRTGESWNGGILSQYRYLYEIPEHFSRCSTTAWFNRTDMRGSVFLSFQVRSIMGNTMMNNAHVCAKYCCREPRCKAWTMRIQEGETRNCDKGSYCCWLKSAVPEVHADVENSTSGVVDRVHTKPPPTGMRSAVPLGGVTTGSFELHADGTFHEWTIENQSPGGSAKLNKGSLDMALLGVRVSVKNTSEAALLRTHPPQGYPGVESLSYSGAYPLSKLTAGGNLTDKVKMDLYAYPSFHPRNPYNSAIPSVAFTLNLENKDQDEAVNVSFLLNLPLGYQEDTIRMGSNYGEAVYTKKILPSQCAKACAKMPKCMAWTTNGPTACLLKDKMPLHAWQSGIISGLKGLWSDNGTMLTMQRPGFFPQSGSTTIYTVGGEGETTSFAVADDFAEIWNRFTETGLAGNTTNVTVVGLHGSGSIQTTLQPGQKKSLTIIMSWFYPYRDHASVFIGNFYSNLFTSSQEAALHMRRKLPQTVTNILEWQAPFQLPSSFPSKSQYANKLPLWLNDMLMNSVSFWRSSFWTKDGRWRQWEAYDCNDIDTIHNDMQRILPYMLFYPEVVRHLLLSWAANQYTNGMMQESLTQGCLGTTEKLDYAGGRDMADSTSMFVVGVYHYYKWTGDKDLLHKLWPAAKRAVTWLIVDSTKNTGLPFRKATFYSLSGIDKYDHHIYDSVVYLLALHASRGLAKHLKDSIFNQTVTAAIDRAQSLIDKEFWSEHYHHYRAWWDMEYGAGDWLMSDSFYGQVWANTLGLGDLVPRPKLRRHLDTEVTTNGSPWGLRVIDDNQPAMTEEDTSLILSYQYPGCESLESVSKHKSIWMGADANWASLMINLDTDPHTDLGQAKKALDHWRSTLHDQWNIHGQISSGGYGQDGLPWANSHANAHLVMWHIPLAISGQQYSAPDRSLTFWPKFGVPFELPFFIPTASGIIEGRMEGNDLDPEEMFTIKVTSGEVRLKQLTIFGTPYGNGEIHLVTGSVVKWSKPRTNIKNILNELKH